MSYLLRLFRSEFSHDYGVRGHPQPDADHSDYRDTRGNSIQRADNGQFMVCDCHQVCKITQSLYAAEQVMEEMEQGYQFPYSTAFQTKAH